MARTGRPKVEKIKVQCAGCDAALERYPSVYNKNKTKRFFCKSCSDTMGFKPHTGIVATCEWCGSEFYKRQHEIKAGRRFCSKPCVDQWQGRDSVLRICEICSKEFLLRPAQAKQTPGRYCSHRCMGMALRRRVQDAFHNGMPKLLDPHGYVKVWEPDRPVHRRWVLEHRLVVEQALGRKLRTDEHVHHINGDKQDNRLENLEVIDPSSHSRITNQNKMDRQGRERQELEEYRRRFGPLNNEE